MSSLIQVKNLHKSFAQTQAVQGLSFDVSKGDVLGFLGPNGAGKSTTMRMIAGFLTPTSGEIVVNGYSVDTHPLKVKESIGYLPEGAPSYGEMTPKDFLTFVANVRHVTNIPQALERVVVQTHIKDVLHRPIETLSKGFKRRVGLAAALIHDPEILILDEPTDGLDPNQKYEMRQLIAGMASTKAIVISTHILEEVEAVCNRAMIIAGGKLLIDGKPHDLMAQDVYHGSVQLYIQKEAVQKAENLFRSMPGVDRLEVKPYGDHNQITVLAHKGQSISRDIYAKALDQSWIVGPMTYQQGRLDRVFRALTKK
jgi:ABC-2 type transport system ATP-binding protein